jgi:hypothetical protein
MRCDRIIKSKWILVRDCGIENAQSFRLRKSLTQGGTDPPPPAEPAALNRGVGVSATNHVTVKPKIADISLRTVWKCQQLDFKPRLMSTEDNVADLLEFILISLILQKHEDKVVEKAFIELLDVADAIRSCHHPGLAKLEKKDGYVCYTRPNLVIIDDIINQIKVVLKSSQHLVGMNTEDGEIALKTIHFEAEEIAKLSELTGRLCRIIAEERLTGYIYINLARLRYMSIWQRSLFAAMKWQEIDTILADQEHENFNFVEELLQGVSDERGWSVDIIKTWIHCCSMYAKERDFYIVRKLKEPNCAKLYKLGEWLVNDEEAMVWVASDDSLLSRSYRQAVATFREDWFEHADRNGYSISKRAKKLFGWD